MGAAERLPLEPMGYREFIEFSLQSEGKYEIWNGELVSMAGAMKEHNRVSMNVSAALHSAMAAGNPCEPFGSDQMVYVPRTKTGRFPDVSVVCGEQEFDKAKSGDDAVLLNPTLIVEVLSKSTAKRDAGEKFDDYRSIPSLKEYVLIDPSEPRVKVFTRTAEAWRIGLTLVDMADEIVLESVGVTLSMEQAYRGVEFSEEDPEG